MESLDTPERAAPVTHSFVGIDVSKAALQVAVRPGDEPWRCANDDLGSAELVGRLQALVPPVMLLEATGGLVAQGKPKKVALAGCMHQLLIILAAISRFPTSQQTGWQERRGRFSSRCLLSPTERRYCFLRCTLRRRAE
jgi:hypothetical protein